eukprot:6188096-Pleurochrysis_carterae.AAC.1
MKRMKVVPDAADLMISKDTALKGKYASCRRYKLPSKGRIKPASLVVFDHAVICQARTLPLSAYSFRCLRHLAHPKSLVTAFQGNDFINS